MSSSVPVTYDNRTGAVATTHDAPTGVDRNNTSLLARYITTDIHPDDMCPEHDSDPYYYGYDWPVCTCERLGNKRLMCTQLILAIPGNPVREKPSECVYTLRVMRHHTTQTDFRESILDISSAEVEFSIAAQIDDPTTMPHDHQEMVTKYTQSLTQAPRRLRSMCIPSRACVTTSGSELARS
ncbi:hypothetical protein B484DRAFT_441485 [Ochromonadaceae sp. CCMP2298]|nr:hypothetical protein B484DRAFT_441485 [Ochromonadaceae sp. CCMP2298]|mmetsp:Transcript_11349/g.25250  ORF Transcript_11349/g.25250 Transcript_11349/m.25250 type:complete len:182 (+) Transcript_11349:228-773(+)